MSLSGFPSKLIIMAQAGTSPLWKICHCLRFWNRYIPIHFLPLAMHYRDCLLCRKGKSRTLPAYSGKQGGKAVPCTCHSMGYWPLRARSELTRASRRNPEAWQLFEPLSWWPAESRIHFSSLFFPHTIENPCLHLFKYYKYKSIKLVVFPLPIIFTEWQSKANYQNWQLPGCKKNAGNY